MPLQVYTAASHCHIFDFRTTFDELLREFRLSWPGRRIVRIVPTLVRFGVELLLSLSIHHRTTSVTV